MANRYVAWLRVGMIASSYDLDCLRELEVKYPDVLEKLLKIAEGPEDDNKRVLLLMEEK